MARKQSDSDEPSRTLPLRFCEVLERECVAVHGQPKHAPTWLLEPGHIDADKVRELLATPSRGPIPSAIEVIRSKLGQGVVPVGGTAEGESSDKLCEKLNQLLRSRTPLYDHCLVAHDTELRQLAELIAPTAAGAASSGTTSDEHIADRTDPGTPSPSEPEHVLLNRLLLEAAFPASAIARIDTVRLAATFATLQSLHGPKNVASALCLSGGGIRSASFALGVLQGLARAGILEKFDYLSTVSGGGYIGSWLSTWVHRHRDGLSGVVRELALSSQKEGGGLQRVLHPEPAPIRFLRSYSHFLNPKAGLFSADTWSWIALYVRNLMLNWLVLIPLLLLVVAVPRLYAAALYTSDFSHGTVFPHFVWLATLCSVLTLVCLTVNRPSISDPVRPDRKMLERSRPTRRELFMVRFKRQGWVLGLGVVPFLIFALVITVLVWDFRAKPAFTLEQVTRWLANTPLTDLWLVIPYVAVEHLVLWGEFIVLGGWIVTLVLAPRRDRVKRVFELGLMLAAGAATWWIVAQLATHAIRLSGVAEPTFALTLLASEGKKGVSIYPAHLYAILAVPVVILAVLAGMTLFIGAVSKFRWIEDEDREWWARFGAWVLIAVVGWAALAAITILGPVLLLEFPKLIASLGGVSGLMAVLLGKSSLTTGSRQQNAGEKARHPLVAALGTNLLALASVVFFAVFLAFLSLLTSAGLASMVEALHPPPAEPIEAVAAPQYTAPADTAAVPPPPTGVFAASRPLSVACGIGAPWSLRSAGGVFSDAQVHLQVMCQTPVSVVAAVALVLILVLLAASLAINLNKFSLHAAYRIRIVRTFLGASRGMGRTPNPFTGFDPLDNVQMHELQPGLLGEGDVVDLPGLVNRLRAALDQPNSDPPARFLVDKMCSDRHDPGGVLKGRLRYHQPSKPVLTALQRNLIESLNRVLEKAPLHRTAEFAGALQKVGAAAVEQWVKRGNLIFANRLLLEAAFDKYVRPYRLPPPPPHKLLHVINLTLNLVRGGRLAWQERKAAPFVVTPLHCGSYYLGYRESRDYGGLDGISIGTAAAVSGAAVSPNMGYSSSPITALLLTLFNVRLGWWLGNPGVAGQYTYRRGEPRFSLRPLISEALGLTDDHHPYVYLSDGGHFENMGLFEMVLRRCRLIVVSDAGADPKYEFEDLGNAVRKIRIDLGIPIEFGAMRIYKRKQPIDLDGRYCTVGRIRYSVVDGPTAPDGILLCIKPAVYGKEPQDVLNYAAQKERFPQEPTSDQFFGETQFESYRQLGEFETTIVCGEPMTASKDESWARVLVERVRDYLDYEKPECEERKWLNQWLTSVSSEQRK